MAKKLNKEALKAVRLDWELSQAVGNELKIAPSAMPETLRRNGPKLNQHTIVEMIANHMGVPSSEILEEVDEETISA